MVGSASARARQHPSSAIPAVTPRSGVVGRSCVGSATRAHAAKAHCAGVLGWMFWLLWNTFSGSYLAFTSASRS